MRNLFMGAALLPLFIACSGGSDNHTGPDQAPPEPFAELFAQGITRYLGLYTPMLSQSDGEIVNYYFAAGDGPLCGAGTPYSMATRDQGSEELMIFLEGGGVCWSDICFYVSEATAGIPQSGLLDPARDNNPVKDWSQVYVSNCDGSMLAGDQDVDTNGDGRNDRFQRGLRNLSAALDVAVRTFPAPRRILLAGQSAGGFGTIFALPLVRYLYPDVPIQVLDDSGVGVFKPGHPELLRKIISELNLQAFIPDSCPQCIPDDGHLTDYLIWQMDQDPTVRRGLLSYAQDTNLADIFLMIGGPAFEKALLEELQQQEQAHPNRLHSWIAAGNGHTFVELEPDKTAGGVPVMEWIGFMLTGSDKWLSVRDPSVGLPPAGG